MSSLAINKTFGGAAANDETRRMNEETRSRRCFMMCWNVAEAEELPRRWMAGDGFRPCTWRMLVSRGGASPSESHV